MKLWMAAALGLAVLLAGACKKSGGGGGAHVLTGVGKPVILGPSHDLRLSPDGKWAGFLKEAKKPRMDGIPPQMLLGDLHVAPFEGGGARKVASGVVNVPGGWIFSPDSKWVLFLSKFEPVSQTGELGIAALAENAPDPSAVGTTVSYMLVSPDSKTVAFVDKGALKLGPLPSGPFQEVSPDVSTAHFAPSGTFLLFKKTLSAAGAFFLLALDGKSTPKKLGEQVGDFQISPDEKRIAFTQRSAETPNTYDLLLADPASAKVTPVAKQVGLFAFSPDSKWLGRTEGARPEILGTLMVGPSSGGAGRKLVERVNEFAFASDSGAVAMHGPYDIAARAGNLHVATLPDGAPKRVGVRVPNFTWASNGKHVAFLSRFLKPIYSVDLMLYTVGEEEAVKVHPGVFGYGFTPKSAALLFRSGCIREGRACDLYKMDPQRPKEPPVRLVEGVYSFKTCEDGERLVVTYAQIQSDAYDVAVVNLSSNQHKTLDRKVALPALCAKPDGSSIAYIVKDPARPGVYLASEGVP